LSRFVRRPLNRLEPAKEMTTLAGLVVGVRTQMTRRGKMLFVQTRRRHGMIEVSVFNELFEAERAKIVTDEVLVVEGKVSYDDFSGGNRVVADKLMTLGEARARFARHSAAEDERQLGCPEADVRSSPPLRRARRRCASAIAMQWPSANWCSAKLSASVSTMPCSRHWAMAAAGKRRDRLQRLNGQRKRAPSGALILATFSA
jgi:DNA polymerase III alpha subunit